MTLGKWLNTYRPKVLLGQRQWIGLEPWFSNFITHKNHWGLVKILIAGFYPCTVWFSGLCVGGGGEWELGFPTSFWVILVCWFRDCFWQHWTRYSSQLFLTLNATKPIILPPWGNSCSAHKPLCTRSKQWECSAEKNSEAKLHAQTGENAGISDVCLHCGW